MTHWKKLADKPFLGAWDIDDGKDLILTIHHAYQDDVEDPKKPGSKEKCLLIDFEEKESKPMILNATNCKSISKAVGSPYIENWAGKKIALFSAKVSAFGEVVDALRVRDYPPRVESAPILCEKCGKKIEGQNGMDAETVAQYTLKKYGQKLCAKCAIEAKKASK